MYTETITQRLALAAGIPPQTANGAAYNTDAIDMSKSKRAFFVVTFGATVGGTVTLSLQESSATGSGWAGNGVAGSFTNSAGTQVQQTLAAPTANSEYTFEVRADQLSPGKQFVRLNVNVSANNNLIAVVAFGDEAIHKPDSAQNSAAVLTENVVT
jgi:hypothetical protein